MDEKLKELIAIGAAVAGHCQPCLTYHVARAKELGVGADEIREALDVGHKEDLWSSGVHPPAENVLAPDTSTTA